MIRFYDHQKRAIRIATRYKNVALYHDMGLGKTYTGAEIAFLFCNPIILLICQKSKINDWVNHFTDNYNGRVIVIDFTKKVSIKEIIKYSKILPVVVVVNYELAWRRSDLKKLKDITLMLDESSLIQNTKAKQTKFILSLNPNNVVLLSGTPCSGKYENLYSQAKLLGWDISEEAFNNTYVNWESFNVLGRWFKRPVKDNPYKNVERLKRKLKEHGAQFLKTEEVINLPEQTMIKVLSNPSKEYAHFRSHKLITINGNEYVGNTSLTYHLYLRQIASLYSQAKLQAYEDLITSTNDRLVVFYNWNDELQILSTIAHSHDRPLSYINGSTKDLTAYETEEDSITFCQYQAGSMGINLQKANKIIYFSLPERSDLFEQSKKRIHRIGQANKCFYYLLLGKGTIEESIYKALEEKRDYTDELFKEEFKEVSK